MRKLNPISSQYFYTLAPVLHHIYKYTHRHLNIQNPCNQVMTPSQICYPVLLKGTFFFFEREKCGRVCAGLNKLRGIQSVVLRTLATICCFYWCIGILVGIYLPKIKSVAIFLLVIPQT